MDDNFHHKCYITTFNFIFWNKTLNFERKGHGLQAAIAVATARHHDIEPSIYNSVEDTI